MQKDFPYIIMNLTESTLNLMFDKLFIKNGNEKMSENERKELFKYYEQDILSTFSGGCLENILNSWTMTLTTGDIIEFVDDEIEELQKKVAKKLGYSLIDHKMELFGKKIKSN